MPKTCFAKIYNFDSDVNFYFNNQMLIFTIFQVNRALTPTENILMVPATWPMMGVTVATAIMDSQDVLWWCVHQAHQVVTHNGYL